MAKRGGFPGGGMPGNMSNLMKQAQRMQRQMEESAKELETAEFTATAGGGAVEVTVTGKKEVTKVKLDPEAVDPDDVEMLEDVIMAAVKRHCAKQMKHQQQIWPSLPEGWEDLVSDGILQQSDQPVGRTTGFFAGYRSKDRTAAGISYY